MSYREKFGSFRLAKIVFPTDEDMEEYLRVFNDNYADYIYSVNGTKVESKGKFGLLSKEQRENFKVLRMVLEVDKEKKTMNIQGYGHRRFIFGLEIDLRDLFCAKKVVCYYAWDNAVRIEDYLTTSSEIEERQMIWNELQEKRYQMFLNGTFDEEPVRDPGKNIR